MKGLGLALLGLVGLAASVQASPAQLKEGNRLFVHGKYDKALQSYNDALIDAPNSSILHFNAGDAAYMSGHLDKAVQSFQDASASAIPLLKAAAHYNRGNALFQQQKWADAVEAYKESLRVNPQDQDAKYNLGVAMRTMQNPPKPSPSPKSGGGQSNKDQSKDGGNSQKDQPSQGDGSASASPNDKMSKDDAERLLDAAGAAEMKKSNQKYPKSDVPHPDEDW